jgi:inorganic pyrophosphatase
MILDRINSGVDAPNDINVIIEIPANADPIKYEIDKETGTLNVDRFIATAMYYPCNYGFLPRSLGLDGDPADVLVVTPYPLLSGSVIRCRPVGLLRMTDEAGEDSKILAVPINKLTQLYAKVMGTEDLSELLLNSIHHFFEHYKDLEPGKWVKVKGWGDAEEAKAEIMASIERYNQQQV